MITVKELMSDELYTLKPTNTVHEARELMLQKRVRHVPIVNEQGKFVGLITKHDILALSVSKLADISEKERDEIESSIVLGEVMIRDVVVANEETNLLEAAQFILEQKHGCLPIFRGTQLMGILTEADFVKLAIHLMEKTAEYQTTTSQK
jgi:CBS domain-containing protein